MTEVGSANRSPREPAQIETLCGVPSGRPVVLQVNLFVLNGGDRAADDVIDAGTNLIGPRLRDL